MFAAIKAFWIWLVDGLTEAVAAGFDRFAALPVFRIVVGEKEAHVFENYHLIGTFHGAPDGMRFEPSGLAARLEGAAIDVEIPSALVLRRSLNPIAAESAPFVEALARHQIERITPWRAADTYFRVATAPILDDSARLSVEVDVVARRIVDGTLNFLTHLKPARLRLLTHRNEDPEPIVIPIGASISPRQRQQRRLVQFGLIGLPSLYALWLVFAALRISMLDGEIADLDHGIETRRSLLAAAARGAISGDPAEALRQRRRMTQSSVETLEALSIALPDQAYLTDFALENDRLRISGISRQPSDLVPALEQSHKFADVTFAAATTREQGGSADRFHLEMRVIGAYEGKGQ